MVNKVIDNNKLKALLIEAGENAKLRLVIESKLSFSTIEKLCAGNYPNPPKPLVRESLCSALETLLNRRIPPEELFPMLRKKGKAS